MRFLRRRSSKESAREGVAGLIDAYRSTCLVVTAVQLRIFERLASAPVADADLATALGAHLPSLRRLLRGLAALDLVERAAGGWAVTAKGRWLVPGASEAHDVAVVTGAEYLPAWSALRHSVLTGEPAFDRVFGTSVWEHREKNSDVEDSFHRFLSRIEGRSARSLLRAFDFSRASLVVDVGGGRGGILAAILSSRPGLRGVVFDRPSVLSRGLDPAAAALGDRCRAVGGSFFDAVPPGGDVYVLARVLHDWDDEAAGAILRTCRAAMTPPATLLVAETCLPEDGAPSLALAMRDLHMLVVLGGRERTRAEYAALLASADLELVRTTHDEEGTDVLEAAIRGGR